MIDRIAEHVQCRPCRPLDLLGAEFGAFPRTARAAPPRGSRRPRSGRCRRCLAGDAAAGAAVPRLVDHGPRRTRRAGARPGFGTQGRDHLVFCRPPPSPAASAQARCLVPNSRSAAPAALQPDQYPRGPVFAARPFGERPAAAPPTSGGSAATGRRTRPPASSRPAAPRSPRARPAPRSGGSRVFITFIPGASADSTEAPDRPLFKPPRDDLDLR